MKARNFKVIDKRYTSVAPNYFPLVFFRRPEIKSEISRARWIWLCVLEILFGAELLENLIITASDSGCPEDPDLERKFGHPQQLALHIPAGIFTGLFHSQIVQLLYYKFYLQYLLLTPVAEPFIDEANRKIHVERVRFRLRKSLLYQLIAFRRVYVATAIGFSISFDILVYILTDSVFATFLAAASLETLRRMFKL